MGRQRTMTKSANNPTVLMGAQTTGHLGHTLVGACILVYLAFCASYLVVEMNGTLRLLFAVLFAVAPGLVWAISIKPDLFSSFGLGRPRTLHLAQENRVVTAIHVVWISVNYAAPALAAMTWPLHPMLILMWLSIGFLALERALSTATRRPMLAGWLTASASIAVLATVLFFKIAWKGGMTWPGTACLVAADVLLLGWIVWREAHLVGDALA